MWHVLDAGFWRDFFTGAKWTDALLVLFTLGLVLVGRKQAKILSKQTEIADRTRAIAFAALGRPYILINTVSHNQGEWTAGERHLTFRFDFRNHGNTPGIIRGVYADVFLSEGPEQESEAVTWPARRFPAPSVATLSRMPGREPFTSLPRATRDRPAEPGGASVLTSNSPGDFYSQTADLIYPSGSGARPLIGRQPGETWRYTEEKPRPDPNARKCTAPVWLIGMIIYESMLGETHHTSFCYRGGGMRAAEEMYGKPYNERT